MPGVLLAKVAGSGLLFLLMFAPSQADSFHKFSELGGWKAVLQDRAEQFQTGVNPWD